MRTPRAFTAIGNLRQQKICKHKIESHCARQVRLGIFHLSVNIKMVSDDDDDDDDISGGDSYDVPDSKDPLAN